MRTEILKNYFNLLKFKGFKLTNMHVNDTYYWSAKKRFVVKFNITIDILVTDHVIETHVNGDFIKAVKTTKKNLQKLLNEI